MDARFRKVRELFGKGGVKFEVPPYQRGYEWDEKNFEDLWTDLQRIEDGVNVHYLGNIIFLKKDDGNIFEIVDGQQRMVTISILMMAIRDAPNIEDSEDRRIDDIINTYPSNDAERKLILDDDQSNKYFNSIWNKNTDDINGNIEDAYKFYCSKVKRLNTENLNTLINKVINGLRVVETVSNDNSLAYMIFQSQNERGKEVSPEILVKARIFGEAEKLENKSEQQQVVGRWKQIYSQLENNLGTPRFNSALRVRRPLTQILINSEYPTSTKIDKSALYRNFDGVLQNHSDVLKFVEWISDQVNIYLQISSDSYHINTIDIPDDAARHLQYLNSVSTHSEVLSLAIYNKVDDDNLLKEFFRLASTLTMRMGLGGYSSADQRDAIYRTARDVRENNDIRTSLKKSIQKNTPEDAEIIEHLKANQMTIRGPWNFRTLLTLVSIEEARRGPIMMDLPNLHVEHIAPRNTFGKSKYSEWRRQLDEDEFDDRKDKLGNLTLLLPSDHSRLDESSFSSKKNTYTNSDVKIAEEIARYDDWTDDDIEERTERLANELTERWSI